jgi:hypothetical protein
MDKVRLQHLALEEKKEDQKAVDPVVKRVQEEVKRQLGPRPLTDDDKKEIILATNVSKVLITVFFYLADFSIFTCATLLMSYITDFSWWFVVAIFLTILAFEFLIFVFFVRLETLIKNACFKFLKENLKITLAVIFFYITKSLSRVEFIFLEIILLVFTGIALIGFCLIRNKIITENELFRTKSLWQCLLDDCKYALCPRQELEEFIIKSELMV